MFKCATRVTRLWIEDGRRCLRTLANINQICTSLRWHFEIMEHTSFKWLSRVNILSFEDKVWYFVKGKFLSAYLGRVANLCGHKYIRAVVRLVQEAGRLNTSVQSGTSRSVRASLVATPALLLPYLPLNQSGNSLYLPCNINVRIETFFSDCNQDFIII